MILKLFQSQGQERAQFNAIQHSQKSTLLKYLSISE